jgi:Fe-S-cluster containining protein
MYFFSWKRAVALALRNHIPPERRRCISYTEKTVFKELFDCLDCGECCHARDGTILIIDKDLEMWTKTEDTKIIETLLPGHFGQLSFSMTQDHRCIFQGTALSPNACSIYEKRATICRSFEMLCPQCLDIRRNRHRPL